MCWLPGRIARAAGVVVPMGVILFAGQRATALLPNIDRTTFEQPYPPLAQALDRLAREHGPLRGLGGYWLARSTGWFCREHVVINALSPQGDPWFHGCNPAHFLPDGDDLRMPPYRFLLVQRDDPFVGVTPAVLALHFGEPIKKIAVGADEIWLYDSLRVPPFDRFLRSRLAAHLCRQRSFIGPIEPACLAQPKANLSVADAPGTIAVE